MSDTHNQLRSVARIVELLNVAGVVHVVHTGDVTRERTLRGFAGLRAPLHGVFGNNDEREGLSRAAAELGFEMRANRLELEWAGRRIVAVHDPRDLDAIVLSPGDVALHGHTHRRTIETRSGALVFNPGECAGHLIGHNAIGIVDLETLLPEILRF